MSEYVLYVGQDKRAPQQFCPGSRQALAAIDDGGLQERVTVQSVEALSGSTALPAWLTGTPTLVSQETRRAMRGRSAVEHLRKLGSERHEQTPTLETMGMTLSNDARHLGLDSNFERAGAEDDMSRYTNTAKITDSDLNRYVEQRKASIPPQ